MNKRVFELSVVKGSVHVCSICLFILLLFFPSYSLVLYAQKPSSSGNTISQSNMLKNSTNAGTLDVLLEPTPYPPTVNSEGMMRFKVSFLKPNSSQIQEHIDFNMRIFKDNKQVFQASNQTGQPLVPLHSTDGYLTVPLLNYQFNQTGKYLVEISVYGILFNPIRPESANFTLDVGS